MTKTIALAALLTAAACGKPANGANVPAEPVASVRLADVVAQGQGATITATGTLGARDEAPLAFKIGGIVGKVLVDEGARVKRGQLLATLDAREIDAMVAKASAGAEKARRDAARAERLYKDSVVTLAQLQDAQTGRDAAEADLRAAKVNQEFAAIRAPGDGLVMMKMANAGQMVGPGTPVLMFGSHERGSVVRVGMPDRDALALRVGMAATIAFDAIPGKKFIGRVANVGGFADPRSGTYAVEIAVEGAASLPSGLVARVEISTGTANRTTKGTKGTKGSGSAAGAAGASTAPGTAGTLGAFSIPAESLVEGNGDSGTVFTVDASGKRARKLRVTLVALDGDRVLVRGLDGVTKVVTSGATWLADSAKVEVKP